MISEGETLKSDIFDANVRDYEGSVEVNRGIRTTLENPGRIEDFWWLNNGVTILATQASLAGKTLALKDPQIVNGFQTSTELSNYLSNHPGRDDRTILARILVTTSEEVRDQIIRATNSQTSVGVFALRATDPLHRGLETYLRQRGLFYERRKNYYKNRGRPRSRIVTVADTAQAVMATMLFRPDDSRARPSSLVKNDSDYQKVFSVDYPIDAFFKAIVLLHQIRDHLAAKGLASPVRNNFRFHMAMVLAAKLGVTEGNAESLAAVDIDAIGAELEGAYSMVEDEFDKALADEMTQDQAAKSPRVREKLVTRILSDS